MKLAFQMTDSEPPAKSAKFDTEVKSEPENFDATYDVDSCSSEPCSDQQTSSEEEVSALQIDLKCDGKGEGVDKDTALFQHRKSKLGYE